MEFEARDESVVEDSFVRIGADLNFARLDKNFQISELSQLLRISKHHLKSIETGDFDSLPGPTYVAGYLRSFAQEVGLDGVVVAQRYRALLGDGNKGPAYSFPIDTQRPQRSGAMLASIIVIFAVAGYGGWYAFGKPHVLTALIGEPQPENAVLPQIALAVTEPDDMAKTDVEPVDLSAAGLPVDDLASAGLADSSDSADAAVASIAGSPTDAVAPLSAPVTIAADTIAADTIVAETVAAETVEAGGLVAEVPILEAAPAVETDIAAISVVETSEATQPVIGSLADGAQSEATSPTGALPTVTLPTDTLPGATMGTSAGGTDLAAVEGVVEGAVEGALTTRLADDALAEKMTNTAPGNMDAMSDSISDSMNDVMSSQIGTGVAFARQRVPDLEITLRATGTSWVEIIRNDGEQVLAKLMRDGETYMVDSRDRLYLSTGNAGGLELVFNDGTVRSVGDSGEILRDLLLDANKLGNQF